MERVSVIIPVRNRPASVIRAINSVRMQVGVVTEILIVDDGSEDSTPDVLRSLGDTVTVIWNDVSQGGARARNQGAEKATEDFLAFLDSDDEWLPNHLSTSIQLLKGERVDGVFSEFFVVSGEKKSGIRFDSPPPSLSIGESILSNYRFDARTSTFVFRKESFLQIKFDEKLRKHQDWDLAIRFEKTFKLLLKREPTILIYTDSATNRMSLKLDHEASFYFIDKLRNAVHARYLFNFCVKQIYRIDQCEGNKPVRRRYLDAMKGLLSCCGYREIILYWLLSNNVLRFRLIKRIKDSLNG